MQVFRFMFKTLWMKSLSDLVDPKMVPTSRERDVWTHTYTYINIYLFVIIYIYIYAFLYLQTHTLLWEATIPSIVVTQE